jgi:hypothetical protein
MRHSGLLLCNAILLVVSACHSSNNAGNVENVEENAAAMDMNATATFPEQNLVFCPVVDARVSQSDCDDLKSVESQVQTGVGAFNVPNPMTRDQTKAITLVVDRRTPEEIAEIENPEANAVDAGPAGNAVAEGNAVGEANAVENAAAAADGNEAAAEAPPHHAHHANHGPKPPQPAPTPNQIVGALEGTTETIAPQVGRFMSADLSGDGFKIEALGPASQEIPPGEQATWEWNVTPTEGGSHTLTLKTVVEGVVAGKHYPLSRTQTIKRVQVDVSWPGWFADELDQLTRGMNHLRLFLVGFAALLAVALLIRWRWKNRDKGPPSVG